MDCKIEFFVHNVLRMDLLDFPSEIVSKIALSADKLSRAVLYMTCNALREHVRGKVLKKGHMCGRAAATGRVKLFLWACKMDPYSSLHGPQITRIAAKHGRMELLKWAHAAGYPCKEHVCSYAALNNDYKMIKWYMKNVRAIIPKTATTAALCNGNFQLVKWLVRKGAPLCYTWAARHGRLNVLKWMETRPNFQLGFAPSSNWGEVCRAACTAGHFHILDWCFASGYLVSKYESALLKSAITKGNLRAVRAICENAKLPRTRMGTKTQYYTVHETYYTLGMCRYAAYCGWLNILKYMHAEGFPWNTQRIRPDDERHPQILEWLDMLE